MLTGKGDFGLDYETFGAVDLRRHGLDRYVNDPSFTPLIVSVAESGINPYTYDFVFDGDRAKQEYERYQTNKRSRNRTGYAHNAGFERAVTDWFIKHWALNSVLEPAPYADTAVISRTQGAAGALAGAARQLTTTGKLEVGSALIQIFCVPNEWNGGKAPTKELILSTPGMPEKWRQFIEYCERDAVAGLHIANNPYSSYMQYSMTREESFEKLTAGMNKVGWFVDKDLVLEMKERYERNLDQLVAEFHAVYDPKFLLNLNSPIQLKQWCEARGIKAKSFDKDSVAALEKRLRQKLLEIDVTHPRHQDYSQVHAMLVTKQEMGGSSLKKLQVILDQMGTDGRLRDQYVHCGAGQTFRTSGRGVQMQNLKRLGGELFDMESLYDPETEADNSLLAANLRQVFTSSHPQGQLIVGDFSSVESRGLAWLAGAEWKIEAFRQGQDLYKVLAASIYEIPYEEVEKPQRQTGKVGELSCGYGAGGGSVSSFAQGMGIEMSEDAGNKLVVDWRGVNPEVVDMWAGIDDILWAAVQTGASQYLQLAHNLRLEFEPVNAPRSLQDQHPGAKSLIMRLWHDRVKMHSTVPMIVLERVFHGVYQRGNKICYYKPSERINGNAWTDEYVDKKTKETVNYSIYGGKITGILTQSMCREMFFEATEELERDLRFVSNAPMIGQFHDELVVDWTPPNSGVFPADKHYDNQLSLDEVLAIMERAMSTPPAWAEGFPLEAEIKHAFRYIK